MLSILVIVMGTICVGWNAWLRREIRKIRWTWSLKRATFGSAQILSLFDTLGEDGSGVTWRFVPVLGAFLVLIGAVSLASGWPL